MAKHLFLPDRFRDEKAYTAKGKPVKWTAPDRDRAGHGNRLINRLKAAWDAVHQNGEQRAALGLPHPDGANITFCLRKGSDLQLKKLERLPQEAGRGKEKIRLRHVWKGEVDGVEYLFAAVWVPKEKRGFYAKKLQEYLQEESKKGNPKHNDLVNCIEEVRTTLLQDYWPQHELASIPGEGADWVEVWLASEWTEEQNDAAETHFKAVCETLSIELVERRLIFPERRVLLAKANRSQLQELIQSCDEVAELRMARECAGFFLREREIHHWIDDLQKRVIPPAAGSPSVCVLDTGVNRAHRLLKPVCKSSDCLTVMES